MQRLLVEAHHLVGTFLTAAPVFRSSSHPPKLIPPYPFPAPSAPTVYIVPATLQSFTPLCYGKPCAGAVAARGASPANGRSTMVVSPLLSVTPAWRDGNPEGRRWGIGDRSDVAGRGRAAGQGALEGVGGEGGDERGGGGSLKEGGLGGLRPAAVLRFVRQSVGRCSGNTG